MAKTIIKGEYSLKSIRKFNEIYFSYSGKAFGNYLGPLAMMIERHHIELHKNNPRIKTLVTKITEE